MKAVVFGDGRAVALAERHEPEPGPGEAMVRSEYCGICGTDLHATRLEGLFVPGVVMGHEFAGEVLALGPDVSGWQPGERVTINPNGDVCGACRECRSGRTNLCRARKTGSVGVKRDGAWRRTSAYRWPSCTDCPTVSLLGKAPRSSPSQWPCELCAWRNFESAPPQWCWAPGP